MTEQNVKVEGEGNSVAHFDFSTGQLELFLQGQERSVYEENEVIDYPNAVDEDGQNGQWKLETKTVFGSDEA